MIIFKTISIKNFLSYGNVPTSWDLDKYPTTLIVGRNGQGKSVLLDAICFALFGKPYRNINKPQLVNSINQKNCVVELTMLVNGVPYKVIRGIHPNVFEVYCNDKMLDQEAAMKDMQEFLETNIIKLNFRTFCQVVILGSAGFTPFMKLSSGARREVIEDVLDISIFSKMNAVLKDRINATREETRVIQAQVESAKKETESQKRIIELIKKNQTTRVAEIQTEIDGIQSELRDHKTAAESIQKQLDELDSDWYAETTELHDKLYDTVNDAKFEVNQITNKVHKIVSMNTCPSCMQGISHEHKDSIQSQFASDLEKYSRIIAETEPKIAELSSKMLDYENRETELKESLNQIKQAANLLVASIKKKQDDIARIQADTGDIESETEKLKSIASNAIRLIQREKELKEEKQLQDIAQILLKDGGIKTAIIKEYLPALNSMINRYLNMFDFFVNFNLDENFNEVIKSRGRDEFSYSSFSEGEKKRLDLAQR
jgi:DNA repair exonuclease SbcCD ATPase subunit